MNFIYTKIMGWILGEALANSDRIKVIVAGAISTLILNLAATCAACQPFLTPDLVNRLSMTIAGFVVTMVASLTHRDVAAPGEVVAGAAIPISALPGNPDGTAAPIVNP